VPSPVGIPVATVDASPLPDVDMDVDATLAPPVLPDISVEPAPSLQPIASEHPQTTTTLPGRPIRPRYQRAIHTSTLGEPGGHDHVVLDRHFLQSRRAGPGHARPMTSPARPLRLIPSLVIAGAPAAIAFYQQAFDARVIACFADPKQGGRIVHAELAIGEAHFYLSEEARDWHNHAPPSLGGTPVILRLEVPDVDAVAARMEAAGATVIYPVADQFYGERSGRLRDPYGHQWLLSQRIREMTAAEIQAGIDAYG
jgi:PhnB protein